MYIYNTTTIHTREVKRFSAHGRAVARKFEVIVIEIKVKGVNDRNVRQIILCMFFFNEVCMNDHASIFYKKILSCKSRMRIRYIYDGYLHVVWGSQTTNTICYIQSIYNFFLKPFSLIQVFSSIFVPSKIKQQIN